MHLGKLKCNFQLSSFQKVLNTHFAPSFPACNRNEISWRTLKSAQKFTWSFDRKVWWTIGRWYSNVVANFVAVHTVTIVLDIVRSAWFTMGNSSGQNGWTHWQLHNFTRTNLIGKSVFCHSIDSTLWIRSTSIACKNRPSTATTAHDRWHVFSCNGIHTGRSGTTQNWSNAWWKIGSYSMASSTIFCPDNRWNSIQSSWIGILVSTGTEINEICRFRTVDANHSTGQSNYFGIGIGFNQFQISIAWILPIFRPAVCGHALFYRTRLQL